MSNYASMSSEQLMILIGQQDQGAFEELEGRIKDRLPRLIQHVFSQSLHSAQDIYQEVLLRIWKHAHRYNNQQKYFSYILVIAKNIVLDNKRKDRLEMHDGDTNAIVHWLPDNSLPLDEAVSAREYVERLRDAIGKLPDLEQRIIWKLYIESKTYEEEAAEMSLKIGAVREAESRGLKKLGWDLGTGFDPGLCR